MTFPEKRWSVLSPTKGDERMCSLKAAKFDFLVLGEEEGLTHRIAHET